jgi:hypothetical protein
MDCLQQNGWDHGRAVVNFEQVKVRIIASRVPGNTSARRSAARPSGMNAEFVLFDDADHLDVTFPGLSFSRRFSVKPYVPLGSTHDDEGVTGRDIGLHDASSIFHIALLWRVILR